MANDAEGGVTAATFASLLRRLGPDAERAAAAYEHLRRGLVSFFTWRGATDADECADETLDRLATRLGQGVAVEDVGRFARGIARMVLLEHWRRPEARDLPLDGASLSHPPAPESGDDETLADCLERCLGELPVPSRELILDYYAAEGRIRIDARKRMADALGISESALRNRAQRLRDGLERCITLCLDGTRPSRGNDTNA